MYWRCWVMLLVILLTGCANALPSSAQMPEPISSAAQPGVAGRGDVAYAHRAVSALRKALSEWNPEEAVSRIPSTGIVLPERLVAAACRSAAGEMALLICQFGPSVGQPLGQAILWFDRGGWQAQLYPQASPPLADERRQAVESWKCAIGCRGGISLAKQLPGPDGLELLVVADLGVGSGQKAEEVHILRLTDGEWNVVWVPAGGDWNYGHAEVSLPPKGDMLFRVRNSSWGRQDNLAGYLEEPATGPHRSFMELWVRKGSGFMMRDRMEEPTPYGSLVRAIHYLSSGADEKARMVISDALPLDDARSALAQKPKRQGWRVEPVGQGTFAITVPQREKRTMKVRLERQGSEWVIVEVKPGR